MNIDSNIIRTNASKERRNLRKIQKEIPQIAASFYWPPDAKWIREATADIRWMVATKNIHQLRYTVAKRLDPVTFTRPTGRDAIEIVAHYDNPEHPNPVEVLKQTKPELLNQIRTGVIDTVVIGDFHTRLYGLGNKIVCAFNTCGYNVTLFEDYGAGNASLLIRDLIGLDISRAEVITTGKRDSGVTFKHESGQWSQQVAEDSFTL